MLHSATTSAALIAAGALTLTAAAPSQAPPARSIVYALLKDPAGNPVKGATGWLRPERSWRLAALPTLSDPGADEPPWPTATSDARGLVRFGNDDWQPGAGSGLVTSPDGLGAVLPRLLARRIQQVTLEPMAELSTESSSESFTVFARARLADGQRVALPPQSGARVRLPKGEYEVWANSADGWIWRRLTLRSGQQKTIDFGGAAQRLRVATDAYVHPRGWPSMPVHRAGEGGEILLRGDALKAALVTWTEAGFSPAALVPSPATSGPITWPADPTPTTKPFDGGIPAATFYGLVRKNSGDFQLVARARADAQGVASLPPPPEGEGWLLAVGDFAPIAVPWMEATRNGADLPSGRGVRMNARARDVQQAPVVDLMCRYTPDDMPAAAIVARTDATGAVDFGLCRGPGVLSVEDPRFSNQRIDLATVPSDTLDLTVERGERCAGTVSFADGSTAYTIVITLRDPLSRLQPAVRTRALRPGESFAFDGLPAERDFLLFATAYRDGKTWSARRAVRSGAHDLQLVLKDEDPKFGR